MKQVFQRLYRLVRFPQREWNRIAGEETSISDLRNTYILPLMEMVIIATLISNIIGFTKDASDTLTWEHILKVCSKELVTCISAIFIGFHLAVLILSSKLTTKLFHDRPSYTACATLTTHTLSFYIVIKILATLFSLFAFLYVALFYLLYIIWFGIPYMFPALEKEKYTKFSFYSAFIICITPVAMENLMKFIMKN
ncbi:MAG: hypothetical protein J6T28_07140 [Paludibacteraceae bacterium]|nr:hypothetical protein [Paludibacteraceae bacterium]